MTVRLTPDKSHCYGFNSLTGEVLARAIDTANIPAPDAPPAASGGLTGRIEALSTFTDIRDRFSLSASFGASIFYCKADARYEMLRESDFLSTSVGFRGVLYVSKLEYSYPEPTVRGPAADLAWSNPSILLQRYGDQYLSRILAGGYVLLEGTIKTTAAKKLEAYKFATSGDFFGAVSGSASVQSKLEVVKESFELNVAFQIMGGLPDSVAIDNVANYLDKAYKAIKEDEKSLVNLEITAADYIVANGFIHDGTEFSPPNLHKQMALIRAVAEAKSEAIDKCRRIDWLLQMVGHPEEQIQIWRGQRVGLLDRIEGLDVSSRTYKEADFSEESEGAVRDSQGSLVAFSADVSLPEYDAWVREKVRYRVSDYKGTWRPWRSGGWASRTIDHQMNGMQIRFATPQEELFIEGTVLQRKGPGGYEVHLGDMSKPRNWDPQGDKHHAVGLRRELRGASAAFFRLAFSIDDLEKTYSSGQLARCKPGRQLSAIRVTVERRIP